jgi:hypothetical protein
MIAAQANEFAGLAAIHPIAMNPDKWHWPSKNLLQRREQKEISVVTTPIEKEHIERKTIEESAEGTAGIMSQFFVGPTQEESVDWTMEEYSDWETSGQLGIGED